MVKGQVLGTASVGAEGRPQQGVRQAAGAQRPALRKQKRRWAQRSSPLLTGGVTAGHSPAKALGACLSAATGSADEALLGQQVEQVGGAGGPRELVWSGRLVGQGSKVNDYTQGRLSLKTQFTLCCGEAVATRSTERPWAAFSALQVQARSSQNQFGQQVTISIIGRTSIFLPMK